MYKNAKKFMILNTAAMLFNFKSIRSIEAKRQHNFVASSTNENRSMCIN